MAGRTVVNDITDALFELLQTQKLQAITVTELIKKAGVCRSSFYRNFYLIEDVIRRYGAAMYENINRDIPLDQGGIREHLLAVYSRIWTQRERLSLIETQGLYYLLEEPMMNQCLYQLHHLGLQHHKYHAAFYAGASIHLIRAWIRNGFQESPQEITDICCDLITRKPMEV